MEDRSSSELESYSSGTVVWIKPPGFWWWPAEVVEQIMTEEKVTRKLKVMTYGDNENENMQFISSPKMIKIYTCSEQKELIEKGRKKCQNRPSYQTTFDVAIDTANKKAGVEEMTEAVEQTSIQHSQEAGNFEIKRKNLISSSNSTSNNCSHSSPPHDTEHNGQCVEHTSTPTKKYDSNTMSLTPTRMETQSRSLKRSHSDSKQEKAKTKRMRQSSRGDDHASVTVTNNVNSSQVTPCSTDDESEDDLPKISFSQKTPTKCYSSLKDVQSKELVWVKHGKDPFWPALVMKDGSAKNVVVNFFAYDGPEYSVRNKKKILPYFCTEKEKFEEEASHNPALKEARTEAMWLLRSGNKECGSTATEQYEAIKKRRSLSQVTPCKRMTYTTDEGSSSSSDDEPMESAFGYDITNSRTSIPAGDNNGGVDEESPRTGVVSQFPKGSPYSYEILKDNFILLESELYSIFRGDIDSENHRIFFQGTAKERNEIQVHNRCGPLYYLHIDHWKELQDIMLSWVKNWSKHENREVHEVKYISDVLFPEATVRTIMKVEHLEKEEAWAQFLSLD